MEVKKSLSNKRGGETRLPASLGIQELERLIYYHVLMIPRGKVIGGKRLDYAVILMN